ncbi:MAG: DUF4258 domain-containing protein [Phycisphaeraceae bacterium]
MGQLFDDIRRAVRENRYLFSDHADNMLRDRSIAHWQIVQGLENGELLAERPTTPPHPSVEVEQLLADGTPVKAVWSYMRVIDVAKLVTVHFFDR